jgi:O-methyltransferase involved in polyketide biosynthesis
MAELKENTVQHTLCMPLCGRMIAARKYPDLFPDLTGGGLVVLPGEPPQLLP